MFIGHDMDKQAMIAALDACLIDHPDDVLFNPDDWHHLKDPFPQWTLGSVAA